MPEHFSRKGQLAIEAFIAMSIIVTSIVGVLALLSNSIALNRVVAERYIAVYLASEGIEVVKSVVDTNIVNGRQWNQNVGNGQYEVQYDSAALGPVSGSPIKFDSVGKVYTYDRGSDTLFRRTISVARVGLDELDVSSSVTWTSRGGANLSVDLRDRFFNWR